jgi:hypothetical protein
VFLLRSASLVLEFIVTKVPPVGSVGPSGMSVYRQLTPRGRLLLSWLAEHYLLSTDQVARALFDSLRTAQQRLTILHRRHVPAAADRPGRPRCRCPR